MVTYALYNEAVGGYYRSRRSLKFYEREKTAKAVATRINKHWTPGQWVVRTLILCVDDCDLADAFSAGYDKAVRDITETGFY